MKNLRKQIQLALDTFKAGKLSEAEKLAKKLINTNPKVVFLYNLLGLILVEKKDFNKALEYYEKGIKIDPKEAVIYNNIAILFYNNWFSGNAKKIENLYKKSISLNENIPETYNNLGNLYKDINKYDDAIKNYEEAIKKDKKFSFAYLNLATTYISLGRINDAKIIQSKNTKAVPLYNLSLSTFIIRRLLSN